MIVEDVEIFPHNLKDIFSDPEKKQKILKIIIQTLYNLGFEQSAAELQKQSKIIYMTPHIKAIKEALPNEEYAKVEQILVQNSLCIPTVMETLNELKCLKMIREGNTEEALTLIQQKFNDSEKKSKLAEELLIGTGKIRKEQLKRKHDFIVEKCLERDISPHSMAKMVNSYIQLEKQGLTKTISPEFSLLRKPALTKNPPMRMANVMTSSRVKNVSFLKFNKSGDKLLVVSSFKKQKTFSMWKVNKIDEEIIQTHYGGMLTEEEVVAVSWNICSGVETVAVAFETKLLTFSVPELKILHSKKLQMGRHIKILTIDWNPLTNFLHVGGAFESVKIFDSTLEEVMTIQPFFRTRKLCFNDQGTIMFGISATKGRIVSYSLFEQKQESCLDTDDIITFFRLENKDKNGIIVTEKRIIYVDINYEEPSQMFSIVRNFQNPYGQNGLVEIQAALFSPWLVFLGQNQFEAASLEKDSEKVEKWNSKKSFTFDISENFMVSGSKEIILWGSGSYQDAMEQEEESVEAEEEEGENNGFQGNSLLGLESRQEQPAGNNEEEDEEQGSYEDVDDQDQDEEQSQEEEVLDEEDSDEMDIP